MEIIGLFGLLFLVIIGFTLDTISKNIKKLVKIEKEKQQHDKEE